MNGLILHPAAKSQLETLVEEWPQGLLLHGPDQIGKRTAIIRQISARHPDHQQQIINGNWSQLFELTPEKGRKTIGVEQIRELNQFLALRDDQIRYVIIDEAERLTVPAQNAFLKNLEQPQANVKIILICTNAKQLLPTIISRTQLLRIQQPTKDALLKWARKEFTDTFEPSLLHVAEGSPGRLTELLGNSDQAKQTADEINQAKDILSATTVKRLSMISSLKSDRERSSRLISHLKVMSLGAMRQVISADDVSAWAERAQASDQALSALKRYANTRLVWLRLMVNL